MRIDVMSPGTPRSRQDDETPPYTLAAIHPLGHQPTPSCLCFRSPHSRPSSLTPSNPSAKMRFGERSPSFNWTRGRRFDLQRGSSRDSTDRAGRRTAFKVAYIFGSNSLVSAHLVVDGHTTHVRKYVLIIHSRQLPSSGFKLAVSSSKVLAFQTCTAPAPKIA
jgi:hypothetical protein